MLVTNFGLFLCQMRNATFHSKSNINELRFDYTNIPRICTPSCQSTATLIFSFAAYAYEGNVQLHQSLQFHPILRTLILKPLFRVQQRLITHYLKLQMCVHT